MSGAATSPTFEQSAKQFFSHGSHFRHMADSFHRAQEKKTEHPYYTPYNYFLWTTSSQSATTFSDGDIIMLSIGPQAELSGGAPPTLADLMSELRLAQKKNIANKISRTPVKSSESEPESDDDQVVTDNERRDSNFRPSYYIRKVGEKMRNNPRSQPSRTKVAKGECYCNAESRRTSNRCNVTRP